MPFGFFKFFLLRMGFPQYLATEIVMTTIRSVNTMLKYR
jgi:hypothetical protein